MGPSKRRCALSPLVIQTFLEVCSYVHEAWRTRRILFDDNPHSELLHGKFGKHQEFLDWLDEATMNYALLQIAKLHDPAVQKGNITLGFDYIVEYGGWDRSTKGKLSKLRDQLVKKFEKLKSARNKILCHNDFATLVGNEPHGGFKEGADLEYFETLKEFLRVVEGQKTAADWAVEHDNDVQGFVQLLVNDCEQRKQKSTDRLRRYRKPL